MEGTLRVFGEEGEKAEVNAITEVERMEDKAILDARWDEMVEEFNINDEVSVDEANYRMKECWLDFLKAGFDVHQVVKMMSRYDVWDHYDTLQYYGAEIDPIDFVNHMSRTFIKQNWQKIVDRGVSADRLAKRCYEEILSIDELTLLLEKGVSPKTAFEMAKGLLQLIKNINDWLEAFSILRKYGLSTVTVREFIKENADGEIIFDIVENPECWEAIGIEPEDFVDEWISRYGYEYFYEGLTKLPKLVTLDRFIDSFSMGQILKATNYFDFESFIKDFKEAGGDVDVLAKKFLDEFGYDTDRYFNTMLDLIYSDATVIDAQKFVDCINLEGLSDEAIESYYLDLIDTGIDEGIINKKFSIE